MSGAADAIFVVQIMNVVRKGKGESVFNISDGTSLLYRLSMEGNLHTVTGSTDLVSW